MSQLKAKCIDQVLIFENTPVITSGNINYDSIMFEFSSAWDGYTKTAIFYRSEDEVYYQLLDKANTCIIPKEVLTDKGDIYIGVFGVNGNTTLTSQVLKYKITKGAITENTIPADPTPDIYAQIISKYNHYDERLAYFENRFNGSVGDAEKLGGHTADYFYPKSGGKITGNVNMCADDTSIRDFDFGNSAHKILFRAQADGLIYVWDRTLSKNIARFNADGTFEWFGTATGNLPITGGTVNGITKVNGGHNGVPLSVIRNDSEYVEIGFEGKSGKVGHLGFSATNNPVYENATRTEAYTLLHVGNYSDYALPKTGGTVDGLTVKGGSNARLTVENTAGDSALVEFVGNGTRLGLLGMYGANTPVFYDIYGNVRNLLHSNNYSSYALPKTGGTITGGDTAVPMTLGRSNGDYVELGFSGSSGAVGYLGFSSVNNPVFENASRSESYSLHHDGNSAKVHIGTSAPSDTSSAWIDTSE